MCSLTSNFEALTSLQEMKEGAKKCEQPIFETWSLENYGQCKIKSIAGGREEGTHKSNIICSHVHQLAQWHCHW